MRGSVIAGGTAVTLEECGTMMDSGRWDRVSRERPGRQSCD
jgi:hypothetical protein